MKHARPDYNRIQDPEGKIPQDEPVFLLRGQDVVAPEVVETWAQFAEDAGAAENIVSAAYMQALEMRKWQKAHGQKTPDMPDS